MFTSIPVSPSITINAKNGAGTLTASLAVVSASQTGRTITFTYTAAAGDMVAGAVTVAAPAGWSAPSTTPTDPGYATASAGVVSAAGQTITVSGVSLTSGSTLTIVYGDTGGGGPGATAGSTVGAQTWQAQEKSTLGGVLANLAASPSITVYAADGSGTATSSISVVSAGQTGRVVTLTYTAATGGMLSGSLTIDVPSGWTPPSTSAGPGFTTSTVGTVAVAGQTITITGITRNAAQTVVVTYGSGNTATASATTGAQTWQIQEASTSAGVLAAIGASPTITVYAADGTGTAATPTTNVSASQTGNTVALTYTVPAGDMNVGGIKLTVPAGWSAPKTVAANAGYTTSSAGTVAAAGQVVTISNLTLTAGQTVTITYGDRSGGGPGATATAVVGAQTWLFQQHSTVNGVFTNLGASPSITINAADGTGTMTVLPANIGNGSTGNTLTFTYTAAAGGMANGDVTVTAPAGWSAPSTLATDPGYTTASTGVVSAVGQTITVSGVTLAGAATMTVVYGSTGGGGPGATAGTTAGANTFQTQERSTAGGVLANIAGQPALNVYAADGSGTLTTPTANVVNGSTNTVVFTYKAAAAGGMSNGTVTLTVPAGWPAPTAGNTTSSLGARSYAGQTVTVSGLTLAVNATFTITYGPAAAPTTGGPQTWSTTERSTAAGTLTALAVSPSINVYARDGSGTLTGTPSTVGYASVGNTETFTYTAAAGGTSAGVVTLVVPASWSAPSITSGNAGYTVSSTGTVAAAGQTITVSNVTLAGGATMTITYGSGAPGATAPSSAGAQNWQSQSKAVAAGVLTNLGSSPSITVAQPPTAAATFPAAAALYGTASWTAGCAGAGFCGTATDNSGAGIQKVELTIRQGAGNYWDGSGFSSGSPVFVLATGGSSWSYAFPASSFPADGSYTVQVRPTDNLNGVGALSSTTFTIDQTPPSAFSLSAPTAAQAIRNGQAVSVPGGTPTDANGITGVAFKACAGAGACTFGCGDRLDRLVGGLALFDHVELAAGGRRVHDRRPCHRRRRQHDGLRRRRGHRRQHVAGARARHGERQRRVSLRHDDVLQGRRRGKLRPERRADRFHLRPGERRLSEHRDRGLDSLHRELVDRPELRVEHVLVDVVAVDPERVRRDGTRRRGQHRDAAGHVRQRHDGTGRRVGRRIRAATTRPPRCRSRSATERTRRAASTPPRPGASSSSARPRRSRPAHAGASARTRPSPRIRAAGSPTRASPREPATATATSSSTTSATP